MLDRLTEKQHECLQLVVERKSSKEIARILNISKPAVDQRVKNARNILGAQSRDEAAIMYASLTSTYDRVTYDPICVPTNDFFTHDLMRDVGSQSQLTLDEAASPYSFGFEQNIDWRLRLLEMLSNEQRFTKRFAVIVGMTAGILSIVLIGLSISQSISSMLTSS